VRGSSVPGREGGEDLRDGVPEHGGYVLLVVGERETAGGADVFEDADDNMMEEVSFLTTRGAADGVVSTCGVIISSLGRWRDGRRLPEAYVHRIGGVHLLLLFTADGGDPAVRGSGVGSHDLSSLGDMKSTTAYSMRTSYSKTSR
jgi:hypothetical protein